VTVDADQLTVWTDLWCAMVSDLSWRPGGDGEGHRDRAFCFFCGICNRVLCCTRLLDRALGM